MATAQFGAVLRQLRGLAGDRPDDQHADGELLDAFLARGDQAAFGLILRRHGPMVLRVCRRTLGRLHDAEDAFQATFLFLAQQAGSVRKKASLAAWLHGVALRMAANARRSAARRARHEQRPGAAPPGDPAWQAAWHEVQSILDEEIQRLPAAYREALVRCCLEHRSCAEVAAHMGLREPAVRARVSRARRLLERRLARRGVSLALLSAAVAVADGRTTAAVAPALLHATAAAAAQLVSPQGLTTGAVSAKVVALLRTTNRAMVVAKVKTALALLLGTLLLAGGTALLYGRGLRAGGGDERAPEAPPARQGEGPPAAAGPRTDPNGDPLPDEALARLGTTRFRPGDPVFFLRFTPDGAKLVTQSDSGVRVWDAATGRELRRFGPAAGVASRGADLSADGKLALTADADPHGTLRLWDVATGRELRQCGSAHGFGPARLAPDGKTIAAPEPRGWMGLRDATTGKFRHALTGQDSTNASATFSADGKTLVVGAADKTIGLLDVTTGRELRRVACAEAVALVALSPDGKLLASIGYRPPEAIAPGVTATRPDNRARVWDATTGKELRQLVPGDKATDRASLVAVAFAPDGKALVTVGTDHRLRVWDATTGKELRSFAGCSTNLGALALAPDGKSAAFANGGTAVRVVDLATGKDRVPLAGHGGGVYAAAVTPDGRTVFTAGGDDVIYAWDAATGKEVRRLRGPWRWVAALALSPDGRLLYALGADHKLRVWQTADGKERPPLAEDYDAAGAGVLVLSADGKLLAAARADKSLELIDASSGKAIRPLAGLEGRSWCGAGFAADGRTLVAWDADQTFHVLDVATGKPRGRFPFAGDEDKRLSYIAALSPDGRLIAFGSQGRFLVVQEADTGKEVYRFDRLPDGVSAVAFSPDGRTLAWGGWNDPTVHLIELATRGERHHFTGHRGRILALHFSPDGRLLVSGGNDATGLVWDLAGRPGPKADEKEPSAEELAALWAALGAAEAAPAYRTVRRLARWPSAVKFLGKQFRPVAAADEKRIAQLVADLDSDEFEVRDRATKELERLGEQAVGACRKALGDRPSAEVRRRLEGLLERQAAAARQPSAERVRLSRALEALELAGTGGAREVLVALARGAPGAWLTEQAKGALGRLDRRGQAP